MNSLIVLGLTDITVCFLKRSRFRVLFGITVHGNRSAGFGGKDFTKVVTKLNYLNKNDFHDDYKRLQRIC